VGVQILDSAFPSILLFYSYVDLHIARKVQQSVTPSNDSLLNEDYSNLTLEEFYLK
jgi:hypothetical protein